MLGFKIQKPLQDDVLIHYEERTFINANGEKEIYQEPVEVANDAPNTFSKYSECAEWCNQNGYTIEDKGNFYEVVEIPVYVPTKDELAEQVRSKRDFLLEETDYFLAPDYPISAQDLEAVKVYRQELRDVPQQQGFPEKVTFPEKPVIQKL